MWSPTDLAHAQRLALSLYSDDPDPGVHGASKWLLKKWNRGDSIAKLDANLLSPEPRPGFGWRIDPSGLTFVVVEGSANGHRFEISDTEVPWRLYKEFAREAPGLIFDHELKAEEAALGMTFVQAASFTNWFSERAGLTPAFGASINNEQVPLASVVSRSPGYRLPTTSEFVLAAKAGTSTDCYFGDDPEMIRHYAFTVKTLNRPSVQAVGLLKPNDFGLFDMLGNALEPASSTANCRTGRTTRPPIAEVRGFSRYPNSRPGRTAVLGPSRRRLSSRISPGAYSQKGRRDARTLSQFAFGDFLDFASTS